MKKTKIRLSCIFSFILFLSSTFAFAEDSLEAQIKETIEITAGGIIGSGYDENFYQNLEKLLKQLLPSTMTSESSNLQKALEYFSKIINSESMNEYTLNKLPHFEESARRVVDIYIRTVGKPFLDLLQNKGSVIYYLDYTNSRLKSSFFFSQNAEFSEIRKQYLAQYFERIFVNQYDTGKHEAYGHKNFAPDNRGWRYSTVGTSKDYYYYNPLIGLGDAPDNNKFLFINELLAHAVKENSTAIVVDLAEIIFRHHPKYANAFLDLYSTHFSTNEGLTQKIIDVFRTIPTAWYYVDPLKEFVNQRVEASFKIKWGLTFLQSQEFANWSNTQKNSEYYLEILNNIENTKELNLKTYHEGLEVLIINKIFEYKRASDLLRPTFRYLPHLSLTLLKIFENILKRDKSEDKEFFKNLILNGHEKVNAIHGLYQITNTYIAELLMASSESGIADLITKIIEVYGHDKNSTKIVTQLMLAFYKNNLFKLPNKELSQHLIWVNTRIQGFEEKLKFYQDLEALIIMKRGSFSSEQNTQTNLALIRAAHKSVVKNKPSAKAMSCRTLLN
jgi:hypothetical protein